MSQSSSCPDTGTGTRGTDSTPPDRLRAAAEHTNDEPLGLQARDKMLKNTGRSFYYQAFVPQQPKYFQITEYRTYVQCACIYK